MIRLCKKLYRKMDKFPAFIFKLGCVVSFEIYILGCVTLLSSNIVTSAVIQRRLYEGAMECAPALFTMCFGLSLLCDVIIKRAKDSNS